MKTAILNVFVAATMMASTIPAQLSVTLMARVIPGPGISAVGTHHVDCLGLALGGTAVDLRAYEGRIARLSGSLMMFGPYIWLQVSDAVESTMASELDDAHPALNSAVTWRTKAPPGSAVFHVFSTQLAFDPRFGTFLEMGSAVILYPQHLIDATGLDVLTLSVPDEPALRGLRVYSQFACAQIATLSVDWLNVECIDIAGAGIE